MCALFPISDPPEVHCFLSYNWVVPPMLPAKLMLFLKDPESHSWANLYEEQNLQVMLILGFQLFGGCGLDKLCAQMNSVNSEKRWKDRVLHRDKVKGRYWRNALKGGAHTLPAGVPASIPSSIPTPALHSPLSSTGSEPRAGSWEQLLSTAEYGPKSKRKKQGE